MSFSDKLVRFLGLLSMVPGMDWAAEYADRMRASQHRRQYYKDLAVDAYEDSMEAKEAGMDLIGMHKDEHGGGEGGGEGADDDRTRVRMPGGAAPAGGDDRTVMRPRPGGRGAAPLAGRAPGGGGGGAPAPDRGVAVTLRGSGLNPLLDSATQLFALARQLHNTMRHPDPAGLRAQMSKGVTSFDAAAREAGAAAETVVTARYALCTLLDEIVLTTPWGGESQWSRSSLLSEFHKETWGGEKFFAALERMLKEPGRHLQLIEFFYVCMCLGLEGKYRVLDRGRDQLAAIMDNTYRAIRGVRGDYEQELSPHWRGVAARKRMSHAVPMWTIVALTGVLLLAAYIGFTYSLAKISEPPYIALSKIGQDSRLTAVVKPVPRTLTLRELLAQDIAAGLVDVIEQTQGSTVEIRGDGFFGSGSADVQTKVLPVLDRIGDAMNQFDGPILVAGHTDNVPLSVAKRVQFPTNWHLSQARAESVGKLVAARLKNPGRVKAEGRGDTEPKASNDTPDGRAQNRRVDVTLLNASH